MNPELVDATMLHAYSDRIDARGLLPHVVRRLLSRTPGVTGLVMPAEEGVVAPGYDGRIDGGAGTAWVPSGLSAWEMGANQRPDAKAQGDYDTRTENPERVVPEATVFVFVTSRRWAAGQEWAEARRQEGVWRDVKVIDAEALHGWLEDRPDVHVWLSERLGLRPLTVRTLAAAFDQLAMRTRPPLPRNLLLAGRRDQAEKLIAGLAGPPAAMAVQAGSREESQAFIAAAIHAPDEDAHPTPLVVRDAEALERLGLTEQPLVLVVANPDEAEVADAVARGHHAVLALGRGDFATTDAIVLDRPERGAARQALVDAGVPLDTADRYAALARLSFKALMRAMTATPGGNRPPWASGPDAPLLAGLLLVGGWAELEGDHEVVSAVTGTEPRDVETALMRHLGSDDPPWARSAGSWSMVSPDDGWTLLNQLLTEQLLQRWLEQGVTVLTEIDPQRGFDQGKRLLADVRGEHQRRYSVRLREGIAQAAALLGGRGAQSSAAGLVPATFSLALVTRVLADANNDPDGALWSTLSTQLPLLAEAAPEAFLDAVATGLTRDPSPLLAMFTDGPGSSPLESSSPHIWLLWALESLAWSPEYLVRSVLALGELASREPGGRTLNRPANSLRAVLLPWYPQTNASSPERLVALDALRIRYPDVAWELELQLLPRMQSTSSITRKPRFRDWAGDGEPVAADTDLTHTAELSARAGQDAGANALRWAELIGLLRHLPTDPRDALLNLLEHLAPDAMDPNARRVLWRALIDEAEKHETMPDAPWSLGAAYAERLTPLAERFQDAESPERHARLFEYRVHIPGIQRDDFPAQREALATMQQEAAQEVYAQGGLEDLVRLAKDSRLPRAVGWAHGAANADADHNAILGFMGEPGPTGAMAAGWVARRLADEGLPWVERQRDQLTTLPLDGQVAVLLELPATGASWKLVDSFSPDVQERYWQTARPFALAPGDVATGVERLLDHSRPWVAVDVLSASVHDGGAVDLELADRALTAAASSEGIEAAGDAGYEVGQVLDAMERSGAELSLLARHEFTFLALLEYSREPRALGAAVAEDPALFADLVRHGHGRDDGAEDPDRRLELASHALQVLDGLHRVPGSSDDALDPASLRDWVHEARSRLDEGGTSVAGDECIGELLGLAPLDTDDAIWPPRAVRDLVEELSSEQLESGLQNRHIRQRGVTVRGVYDGGVQERNVARALRRDASALDVEWPRTARLLRTLASTYDSFASHEDRQAQRSSDDD